MSVTPPKIVVGLGNPGARYEKTRHNIGFMVLDELARRLTLDFSVSEGKYLATAADFEDGSPVLLKPLTYMNLSGEALVSWGNRSGEKLTAMGLIYPEPTEPDAPAEPPYLPSGCRPFIICDDLLLPLGAIRLRGKGRSGGQNGIQSIIDELEGEVFPRLRLGVAPKDVPVDPEFWADYVLAEFEPEEWDDVREVVAHAADAVEFWLESSLEKTASRFNRRRPPE